MKQNLKIQNQIKAYSAAAVVFVQMQHEANAQAVYFNIDPDENLYAFDELQIDFNDDGFIDIGFEAHLNLSNTYSYYQGWSTYTLGVYFYVNNFSAIVRSPVNPILAANLQPGDIIGEDALWNTNNEVTFAGFDLNIYSYSEVINGWNKQNNYIGVKFEVAGQTHYGWVRLSIDNLSNNSVDLPKLIIQDYAYEATPNTPITIEHVSAAIAENLILKDIGETSTANDLQLSFNKAIDETFVSEYRVFLHRIPDAIYNSLDALLALPADRYNSIIPDGTNHVINFNATTLDTDGNPIMTNSTYEARVVSIPDGIQTSISNVSVVSNKEEIMLRSTGEAQNIKLFKNGTSGTIGDFKVTFMKPANEYGISAYRVYITKFGTELNYDTLYNLDENYFVEIASTDQLNYEIQFPTNKKTVGDEGPIIFESYWAAILTIPDSIAATEGELNFGAYTLYYTAPLYPETPLVILDDTTKTPHDIFVSFPMSPLEQRINEYEIILVPADDTSSFSATDVDELPATNYYQIMPVGEDIATHLPSFLKDVNGNTPNPETTYVVYVAISGLTYYNTYITLSHPSKPFTLNDGKINATPQLNFNNNALYYSFPTNDYQTIQLFDISGRIVAEWIISGSGVINNFDGLTPGVYFIQYNQNANVIKIFIDKH